MDPVSSGNIHLRNVELDDLPWIYQLQCDPESNRLAGTIPRTAEAFEANWTAILRDKQVTAKVIVLDEMRAGQISCFWREGQPWVGYWISRDHWGKGIATRSLQVLLQEVALRPLHAQVATHNPASLRVLQKCGFVVERVELAAGNERFLECEVSLLVLKE